MKIKDSGLTNYNDDSIYKQEKEIIKTSAFVGSGFLGLTIILTIIFPSIYSLIIGYVVGGVLSMVFFHYLSRYINESYYGDFKKVTSKLHIIFSCIYILTFVAMYLIFKSTFGVIGALVGFLLSKIAIIVRNLMVK